MKSFNRFIAMLIYCFSFGWTDPGDLIDYNHQSSFSVTVIEFILNSMGNDLSLPVYSISVYDIHYESHRPDGTVDTLSGLISIPQSPTKAFPIAAYQHGTILLDNQAPSITGMSLNNLEILLVGLITTPSGFVSIFPDYAGLGDPENFHPYIIADSHTRAVVNMIRALRQLSEELTGDDQFQLNDQLFLIGYSDGGYATLAAQRGIQLHYPDEFPVTASCPMAGPYDLAGTMVDYFLSEPDYSQPYYVPYVLTSHLWYYQGLDVDFHEYFEPFWADTLPSLFDGTHSGGEINEMMPDNPLDILLPEVLDEFINSDDHFFRQTLQENTLLDWVPESPTYFYHGLGDDIVPYENAQVAYDTFVDSGASNVNLILYPVELGGHSEVAPTCLFAGYEVILDYQTISPKGDMNGDGSLFAEDMDLLSESTLFENDLTEFQWWAGDIDYDDSHSVFDLLRLSDLLED